MAIDSWTSEGMDWSSADALRMKPLYPYLEAIRLAIIERKKALGLSLIGIWADTYDIRLKSLNTITNAMQIAITDLISRYVNSSQTSWQGATYYEIAPSWTESGLLTYIGAEKRELPSKIQPTCSWLYQQYLILNELIYYRRYGNFIYPKTVKVTDEGSYGFDGTWSEVSSAFNAAGWSGVGDGWDIEYQATQSSEDFFNIRNSGQRRMSITPYGFPLESKLDIYLFSAGADGNLSPYLQFENCTESQRWNLQKTLPIADYSAGWTDYLFNFSSWIAIKPAQIGDRLVFQVSYDPVIVATPSFRFHA